MEICNRITDKQLSELTSDFLIEVRDWKFLIGKNIYSGEPVGISHWDDWNGRPWELIWKRFLYQLGEIYEFQLSDVNPIVTPECGRPLKFLYEFILHEAYSVHACSEDLKKFRNKKTEEFFKIEPLNGRECNPDIPSSLFYITPIGNPLEGIDVSKLWYSTKSQQESFEIFDSKSKYERLDVSVSGFTPEIMKLTWDLEHVSKFTCERCGAQPRDSRGNHIIWRTKKGWQEHYCKSCARYFCYQDRHYDYKDALLTGTPYYGGPAIKKMMEDTFKKDVEPDHGKIIIKSYSGEKETEIILYPWKDLGYGGN